MNTELVKTKLIEALQVIQADSGLACPPITNKSKPVDDLPEFDSKIWPVATGMLAVALGIDIPPDINIFRIEKSCTALAIEEIVALVVTLMETQIDTAKRANES